MLEPVLWYLLPPITAFTLLACTLVALSVTVAHLLYPNDVPHSQWVYLPSFLAALVALFVILALAGKMWQHLEWAIADTRSAIVSAQTGSFGEPPVLSLAAAMPQTQQPTMVATQSPGGWTNSGAASSPTTDLEVAQWEELIQEQLKQLRDGQLVFNPPDEMTVGEADRVEARIAYNPVPADLKLNFLGAGVPITLPVKVGVFMQTKLTAENFDIAPRTDELQVIEEGGFTRWLWDVLPLESGTQDLLLTVDICLKLPEGVEAIKNYTVLEKPITVHVNPAYTAVRFLDRNWQWITTVVAIPIVAWAYKQLSSRNDPPPGPNRPPRRRPGTRNHL